MPQGVHEPRGRQHIGAAARRQAAGDAGVVDGDRPGAPVGSEHTTTIEKAPCLGLDEGRARLGSATMQQVGVVQRRHQREERLDHCPLLTAKNVERPRQGRRGHLDQRRKALRRLLPCATDAVAADGLRAVAVRRPRGCCKMSPPHSVATTPPSAWPPSGFPVRAASRRRRSAGQARTPRRGGC